MGRTRGSVLAIALLIIAALSATAVALANYLSTETRLMRYYLAQAQARALANGGLVLAMIQLAKDVQQATTQQPPEPYDWLGDNWSRFPSTKTTSSDTWEITLPAEDSLNIRVVDEERKLNVNRIEDQDVGSMVKRLLNNSQVATEVIADYIDGDVTPRSNDSVEEIPGSTGVKPYKAKNAPVVHVTEILSIPPWQGLPQQQDLTKRLLAHTTVAPTTTVNINTAPQEVLEAVGLPTLAKSILTFCQQGGHFTSLNPMVTVSPPTRPVPFNTNDAEFLNARKHLDVKSTIFTVRVDVSTRNPMTTSHIEVIVSRQPQSAGPPSFKVAGTDFQVLSWKEL